MAALLLAQPPGRRTDRFSITEYAPDVAGDQATCPPKISWRGLPKAKAWTGLRAAALDFDRLGCLDLLSSRTPAGSTCPALDPQPSPAATSERSAPINPARETRPLLFCS